jgi:hypothetical protein
LSKEEKSLVPARVKLVAPSLTTTLSTEIVDDLFVTKTCLLAKILHQQKSNWLNQILA